MGRCHADRALKANFFPAAPLEVSSLMRSLLIKSGHRPWGLHFKKRLPADLRALSPWFIFALMPLCSAAYWCFCHIVKIYGAISLSWNGLIRVSGPADLWPNMAGGEENGRTVERKEGRKERETRKAIPPC